VFLFAIFITLYACLNCRICSCLLYITSYNGDDDITIFKFCNLNFKNNINISVTLIIFIYQNGRKDYNIFAVSSWFSFSYKYYMTYIQIQ